MIALSTTQMFLFAAVMFASAGALSLALLTQPLLRWTEGWAPAARSRALLSMSLVPAVIGAAGLASVMLPSVLGFIWPALDHCPTHGGRHAHLCFVHGSLCGGTMLGWVVLAAIGSWLVLSLGKGGLALLRASRAAHALMRAARPHPKGYWVVDSQSALCVSVGLLRPRLIVSTGLLASLSKTDLEVIAAHEAEHERRRDTLLRLVARVSTACVVPQARRALLAALEASAERACDERAAALTGDRLAVAEAILAVERELEAAPRMPSNAFVMGFGGSAVAVRVQAMLEPAREAASYKVVATGLLLAVAALLGGFEQVHHLTETLLGHTGH